MTTRTDVIVDFYDSPRVAEVEQPSTEMNMQDLVDTLRIIEEQFTGISFDKLLNASGKEDLGGSVKVGITAALQNALLAFEGRTTPAQVGTVTGAPANPVASRQTVQDTGATFQTNLVKRGSLLVNFTDQSVAEVYRVNSETELETKILVAGIGNTYDVADDYKIWNIVQVTALGGNLVAVDDMGVPLASPVLPTAFTQIVLTASSSATIVETGVSGLTAGESAQLTNIETITLSLQKLMKNRMETNPTTGIMTIYDDDDVTPLLTGNIYEDVLATQIYRGRGVERRNRLT